MLEETLEQDIKSALLSGDMETATTLRGLKASLLNYKVAKNKRDSGITDDEVMIIYSKEAKQRQESADLYLEGGDKDRADKELREKAMIEKYLPAKLSESEVSKVVEEVISSTSASGMADLGKVIGLSKAKLGATADGGTIAKIAKEKLS